MTHNAFTRRDFVKSAIAGGALFAAPALLSARHLNERLNVAVIAVGGRGGANLKEITSYGKIPVNIAVLCDVDERHLSRQGELFPQAQRIKDFRRIYDGPTDGFDAVVVSTPEHTHAYATLPALRLKKHVYCEKPLTHNVREARAVTLAAAKAQVATQMGTQIHSLPNYHRVVELIQTGAIGKVTEAHVWVSRAWGRQSAEDAKAIGDIVNVLERPEQGMTPPEFLDWDLWLGPAQERPFHEDYFPGPKWYRWWEFGNGTMSDLGSHWNDLPYWALELDAPKTIEASGPPPHPEIAPASMTAVYEYGPRAGKFAALPGVKLSWYQGSHKPAVWTEKKIPQWGNGVLFVGDKGMLLSDYSKHLLLPEEKFTDFKYPEPYIPDSPGQQAEWLEACVNGTPTASPFSYAGPLTEANHLGNVAYRAGKKIEWDAKNMKIPNAPEAEVFLGREPRAGWSLE